MRELQKIIISGEPPTTTQKNTIKFNRKTGHTYHTKAFNEVRTTLNKILAETAPESPYDGTLALYITAYFTPPNNHKEKQWKNTKPDGDNFIAVIADQLEKTGYVVNDSRFALEHIEKHYDGDNPRTEIIIYDIKGE